MQALRADAAALRRHVKRAVAPVRRHLAAAVGRVVLGRADGGEKHLARRHAERQAQRAIAVVREEPVVARLQLLAGGDQDGLVAGAADLEERLLLVLELNLLVVDPPRQEHQAIGREQLVARQALVFTAARLCRGGAGLRAVGQGRPLHRCADYGTKHRLGPRLEPIRANRAEHIELEGVFQRFGLVGCARRDVQDFALADDDFFAVRRGIAARPAGCRSSARSRACASESGRHVSGRSARPSRDRR